MCSSDLLIFTYHADRPQRMETCSFAGPEWLQEYEDADHVKTCLLGDWLRDYERTYRGPAPLVMVGLLKGDTRNGGQSVHETDRARWNHSSRLFTVSG